MLSHVAHALRRGMRLTLVGLDADYEPLTFARVTAARGAALSLKAELTAEVDPAADARWGTVGPYERLATLLAEPAECPFWRVS